MGRPEVCFERLGAAHVRQSGEQVGEIRERFDPMSFACFQDGVDDRAAVPRVGMANEQPVLGAEFGGPDTLFGEVVVDAHGTVLDVGGEFTPLVRGIGNRFAQQAVAHESVAVGIELLFDLREHRQALQPTLPGAFGGVLGQGFFRRVELTDEQQVARGRRFAGLEGGKEPAPGVRPAE